MKRRLTDNEALLMATPGAPHPDFEVGDLAYVLYTFQDPVPVTVVGEPTSTGWVEVEQEFMGEKMRFQALAAYCVKRGDE